jgi:hypothetical protein
MSIESPTMSPFQEEEKPSSLTTEGGRVFLILQHLDVTSLEIEKNEIWSNAVSGASATASVFDAPETEVKIFKSLSLQEAKKKLFKQVDMHRQEVREERAAEFREFLNEIEEDD